MAIADRDDVVMKHAAIDSLRRLLGKHRVARIQLMQAGHRFAGLEGLPRRILHRGDPAAGASTIDKKLHPLSVILPAEAVMVGRPFIAEVAMLRQRRMVGEVARIGERGAQDRRGGGRLLHTVQLIVQVGDGEMDFAIGAVRRR